MEQVLLFMWFYTQRLGNIDEQIRKTIRQTRNNSKITKIYLILCPVLDPLYNTTHAYYSTKESMRVIKSPLSCNPLYWNYFLLFTNQYIVISSFSPT